MQNKLIARIRRSVFGRQNNPQVEDPGQVAAAVHNARDDAREREKDAKRRAYADELKRNVQKARGLRARLSQMFSLGRKSQVRPLQHSKSAPEDRSSKQLEPLQRRTSGIKVHRDFIAGVVSEYVYVDFKPIWLFQQNRFETVDTILKRVNKWLSDNQIQPLSLETLLIPAGNLVPEQQKLSEMASLQLAEVLRVWYDKGQVVRQGLRKSQREVPATIYASEMYNKSKGGLGCFGC